MVIQINNKPINIQIKYSYRKSVYLTVISQDKIEIRSPFGINDRKILSFILKNEAWITDKLNKANDNPEKRAYNDGETFYYQGQGYTLKVKIGDRSNILVNNLDNTIRIECREKNQIKYILTNWYKDRASCYIMDRVNYYESIIGVKAGKIRIKNQRTIWGSCSSKNNLNFNVKLIMMPDYIIDYVVVHEICHLIHFNHSKEFWKKVEEVIPDYKERRKYLKLNGNDFYL